MARMLDTDGDVIDQGSIDVHEACVLAGMFEVDEFVIEYTDPNTNETRRSAYVRDGGVWGYRSGVDGEVRPLNCTVRYD